MLAEIIGTGRMNVDSRKLRGIYQVVLSLFLALHFSTQTAQAQTNRVSRVLSAGQSLSIRSYQCALLVTLRSTSNIGLRCKKSTGGNKKISKGKPYLRAKQTATIQANACLLQVSHETAKLVTLNCVAIQTADISVSPASLSLTAGGSADSLTITNNSQTLTATNIQATLPSGWSDVSADASSCGSVAPLASCTIALTPSNSTHAQENVVIQGTNTTSVTAQVSVDAPAATTLASSVSALALSVNAPSPSGGAVYSNPALTGTPRIVTINNSGANAALDLQVTYSNLPTGSSGSSTCGSTLAASASCTVTITPGAPASSSQGSITVQASNASSIVISVEVLTYGNIYQGGYVFSIDDTTPNTGSVGGKVLAQMDQSTAIAWEPGCNSVMTCSVVSADSISDGTANSAAIVTALSGTYAANAYAAGLCTQTISGYSDWYLPAICELSYGDNISSACGTVASPLIQNIQSSLVDNAIVPLSDLYWSSSKTIPSDPTLATLNWFAGVGFQAGDYKETALYARCARAMTL